jgi:N-methylhydantoinase A
VIDGPIDAEMMSYLEEAFGAEHERTYGHRAGRDEPVELVSMQVIGAGLRAGSGVPERVVVSRPEPVPPPPRAVYFGKERGWIETPVMRRSDLKAASVGTADRRRIRFDLRHPAGCAHRTRCRRNIVITL